MTDRELLELAAKAAGYNVRWHERWHCYVHVGPHNISNPPTMAGQRQVWVPLDDDGDALRLAVDLRIDVYPWISKEDPTSSVMARNSHGFRAIEFASKNRDCRYASTRRAIVLAAAEIGRQMP